MKKHIAFGLVASTLFLAGCCTSHHPVSWEYQTRQHLTDAELNALGMQGWRVVGFSRDETGQSDNKTFVLERKKQ
jgi:hypothetical protein